MSHVAGSPLRLEPYDGGECDGSDGDEMDYKHGDGAADDHDQSMAPTRRPLVFASPERLFTNSRFMVREYKEVEDLEPVVGDESIFLQRVKLSGRKKIMKA